MLSKAKDLLCIDAANSRSFALLRMTNLEEGTTITKTAGLRSAEADESVRPYVFCFGAFIPNSFITICRSFHASPFCRGSRSRNAG